MIVAKRRLIAFLAAAPRACAVVVVSITAGFAGAAWSRAVMLVIVVALGGCAALPDRVVRGDSYARRDTADTALAKIAEASRPQDAPGLSGFRLLADGEDAFEARLALIRRAEKTIDAQYYLIANDRTGHAFLRELRDAARRGVRVRLLVDDLYETGEDALFAGLSAHDNVEVRTFNPLPVRGGGLARRVFFSLHEFARVNHRMHNKVLIADNAMAITGGRNIADLYFERGGASSFIDIDVLASGPVAAELATVFDRYWNSVHAYAVEGLVGDGFDRPSGRDRCDETIAASADAAAPEVSAAAGTGLADELAAGRVRLHFAKARVLADAPDKVDQDAGSAEGLVTSSVLELIGAARSQVLIASPYFVPGAEGLEAIGKNVSNRVSVSVLTNSLSTTDEPIVHFGYMRYRRALLDLGVGLYELMPTAERAEPASRDAFGSSARLHAKLVVVDDRHVFIGSMNMDRRSSRLNTELGLVIESEALADEVTALLRAEQSGNSYRLRIGTDPKRLEWVRRRNDAEVTRRSEPAEGSPLGARLTAMFVSEEML
jgi:putative cardiolipin synthase